MAGMLLDEEQNPDAKIGSQAAILRASAENPSSDECNKPMMLTASGQPAWGRLPPFM